MVVGWLALATPAIALVVLGASGATIHAESWLIAIALLVVTLSALFGIHFEWRGLRRTTTFRGELSEESGRTTGAILLGTLVTLASVIELGLSPVVAAGVVGILVALFAPSVAIPAYCGAFVGMTSPDLFPSYWHAVIAGGVAGLVYLLARPVFHGIGGKLGTTAFVGATITVLLTAGSFQSQPLPSPETVGLVVGYATVGAVATFGLHTRTPANPVLASGIVGVVGGVGLPLVHGDPGALMAAGVFAASFAGMTDRARIPTEWGIALSGAIVGLLVVYTMPYFGGSGGKLGTIAFVSCLAVYGLLGRFHVVRLRRDLGDVPRRDVT